MFEVAVVGGAATRCQLASVFAAFGSRVWLLDVAPRVLGGEDEAVSGAGVSRSSEEQGVPEDTTTRATNIRADTSKASRAGHPS
jgi:pyruvate/2-oxoglutarate dehydrogenase complex dihydrolipoamide dehydrogenase (E3) component